MDAVVTSVVMNSDSLNGVYRDYDRGQLIQVSKHQYVIGEKPSEAPVSARVDLDKKEIFLRRDK